MKGISAVIASILLLLVAIAIMGFAFGFFQRLTTTSGAQTEQQLNTTTNQMQTAIKIDNVAASSLTVRNIGSVNVAAGTLGVYVNNIAQSCTNWSTNPIPAGDKSTCTSGFSCASGQQVRVTSAGVQDAVACP